MKVLLDACVLYPTVMREILIGVATKGRYQPLWSERILEEWARAAARGGEADEMVARGEIAILNATWPNSSVQLNAWQSDRFWLPDANDIHVLAAAVVGNADAILTLNAKDFPSGVLREEGLDRLDPDGFLMDLWYGDPSAVSDVAERVRRKAKELSGKDWTIRKLLKKARLPRLGKALENMQT